jgi:hypothetical protein
MFHRQTSLLLFLAAICAVGTALADGTEVLGPTSVPLAHGSGIVAAGTGMIHQPGLITVEIPAEASVEQVLLYWEGFMINQVPGDATIVVDDGASTHEVTGSLIGGPTYFFTGAFPSAYRADITELDLIQPGVNTLAVSGLEFTMANNGAGVIVIYDDGSSDAYLDIRDGVDLAFINFMEPRHSTHIQSFRFDACEAVGSAQESAPSECQRTALLSLFFASVSGTASGGSIRPTSIEITTSGSGTPTITTLSNVLDSVDGDEWDTFTIAIKVPKGDSMLEVEPFSRDDHDTGELPASFDWNMISFVLEDETQPLPSGRMTGGGTVFTIDNERVTHGFQIHCDLREPNNLQINWPRGNRFHMTELTAAVCTDSPTIDPGSPEVHFDTFQGKGVGRLNNEPGATIEFVFVDAGEPGNNDTAMIAIRDAEGNLVLEVTGDPNVPGYLDRGNHQAHDGRSPVRVMRQSIQRAYPRLPSGH